MKLQNFIHILMLSLLLVFTSCGKHKGGTSTASFKLAFTATFSEIANAGGGVMIYGISDAEMIFAERLWYNGFELDLPSNTTWRFYAFAWDGATAMGGDVKCAASSLITLDQPTIDVNLSLSKNICFSSAFSPAGNWWDNAGTPTWYTPTFQMCDQDTTQAYMDSNTSCNGTYTGNATGMRIILPSFAPLKFGDSPPWTYNHLVSNCISVSNTGYAYPSIKIPFGNIPGFPMVTVVKFFHDPNYPTACSGESCCTGWMEDYVFPRGLGNPEKHFASYDKSMSTVLVAEQPTYGKIVFDSTFATWMGTGITYKACNSIRLQYQDNGGTPDTLSQNVTVDLSCTNATCAFYSDASCTATITQKSMASGSTDSSTFYIRQLGPYLTMNNYGDGLIKGHNVTVDVNVTYANIDYQYLFFGNVNLISATSPNPSNMLTGTTIVYHTRSGNKGKMYVNSRSTTTNANDTINFDYVTYNSSGGIVSSNTNRSSVACFSTGNCYWDFDDGTNGALYASGAAPTDIEGWWEWNSGLYFIPQASMPFRIVP